MRGPPPQWNPPPPPSLRNESTSPDVDESQYEEPEVSADSPHDIENFLNIPPPSCPPPPSSTEMRGPPPQWNPPPPPSLRNESTSPDVDESQYEEPEVSADSPHDIESSFSGAGASVSKAPLTTLSNNYEISTSQQVSTFNIFLSFSTNIPTIEVKYL
uniref:Inverted formin-2 n=1 Tax=Ascaris lumbricoides TaxID=6252 RepID=A0A0M3IKB0_ASCLU